MDLINLERCSEHCRFRARDFGAAAARRLSRPGSGQVHSAFARSLNLLCRGRLVTLLESSSALHPFGVRIYGSLPKLELGQGFRLESGILRFDDGKSLSLAGCITRSLARPDLRLAPGRAELARLLAGPFCERSSLSGLLDRDYPASEILGGLAARRFLAAFGACDTEGALEQGLLLLGLGPGLTPAFDDFFLGLAASLALYPAQKAQAGRRIIARLAGLAHGRTTLVSWEFLCSAAQGQFPEQVLAVLEALALPEAGRISLAMLRLCSFGHSSGADSLVGLLAGLSLLTRDPANRTNQGQPT